MWRHTGCQGAWNGGGVIIYSFCSIWQEPELQNYFSVLKRYACSSANLLKPLKHIYVKWWVKKANMILIPMHATKHHHVKSMIYRASNETDTYNDILTYIHETGVLLWNTFEICLHPLFPNLLEEIWNQKLTQSMLSKREINKSFSQFFLDQIKNNYEYHYR